MTTSATPRLKKATQLAQAEAREMLNDQSEPRPSLLSDETLAFMEKSPRPSEYTLEKLFSRNGRYVYLTTEKTDKSFMFVDQLAQRSGLAGVYEKLLNDPAELEALSQEAANYAVGVANSGKTLQLLEQGVDLAVRDGALKVAIRRQSDRQNAVAQDRVRHRSIVMKTPDPGRNSEFSTFASCAIHARVDPRQGRFRRDGEPGSSTKSRSNVFESLPGISRPNYSLFISRCAEQACRNDERLNRQGEEGVDLNAKERLTFFEITASLRAVNSASQALRFAVAQRAVVIAKERQAVWMEQHGIKEAYELAQRVWGNQASLSDIEIFKANEPAVSAILDKGNLGIFALRMARGFGIEGIAEDLTGQVKAQMSRLGLSDGGWRRLNQINPDHLRDMASAFSRPIVNDNRNYEHRSEIPVKGFAGALSVTIANNVPPAVLNEIVIKAGSSNTQDRNFARAFSSLCDASLGEAKISSADQARHYIAETEAKASRLPHVVKAFALRSTQAGASIACEELELLRDYLQSSEMGVWQQLPAEPNWGQLMRAQRDWHELVQSRAHGRHLSWEAHLASHASEESGYEATALVSGYELLAEGKAMHHCVSSYAKQCHDQGVRIFSVTRDGARFGTLELRPDPKDPTYHKVNQFKGVCNAAIAPEDAWAFARQVAELYTEAAKAALKSKADSSVKAPAP